MGPADQGAQLAFTGVNHVALLFAVAVTLIVTGLIFVGLARRHRGIEVPALADYTGPPPVGW